MREFCNLNKLKSHLLWLQAPGRWFLLSERGLAAQIGNQDFQHVKGRSKGFFAIVIACKGALLYLILGSRHFVFYPHGVKEILPQKLTMEELSILLDLVFIVHRSLQHSGTTWGRKYCPPFQIDLIPKVVQPKTLLLSSTAIGLIYQAMIRRTMKKTTVEL